VKGSVFYKINLSDIIMNINVKNPATSELLYELQPAGEKEIGMAYDTAREIQQKIGAMTIGQRVAEIVKISQYLIDHYENIATRIMEETGKSKFEALSNEIFEICDGIDYYRDAAKKILKPKKVHTPLILMGKKSKIYYEPLGTVLVIAPWNYPLIQCFLPSLLAFLAGNAVIFKPSEVTPLKGLYEQIMEGAGFMKNAIQIMYGGKETGAKLIEARPDKIHFTGSTRAGRQVMAAAAKDLIPVDLELGGKDPSIVFEDVNIEKTANGVIWGAFTNAGQSCTSIERCYVHESIYDRFVDEVKRITAKLRVPDPKENNTGHGFDVGCMTAPFQLEIVEKQLEDAVQKGANVLVGGKRLENSMVMPPTVVVDLTKEMQLINEETFGPVLPIIKFKTEKEVIQLANDTEYGLGASVWSKDIKRANRVALALKAGNIAINNHMLTEANPALPFGGMKNSGFGRYKGDEGLITFSNIKSVISGPNDKVIEPHWYPFTAVKYETFPKLMRAFFSRPRKWLTFAMVGLKLDSLGGKERIKTEV